MFDQIESAEIAGYLPCGEGWRLAKEGQTAFDGDKPVNINGGRSSFGHAYGASGLADGLCITGRVTGIQDEGEIAARLPLPVKAEIIQDDGFKTVIFHLAQ